MQTVGDYLKKGREAQNISLSDVAEFTKISKIYLDCLEKGEYKKIPGETYIKGYISSYAECLGINEQEALKLYKSFRMKTSNADEIKPERPADKKRPRLAFASLKTKTGLVLTLSIIVISALGVYYPFFWNQKKDAADRRIQSPAETTQTNMTSKIETNFTPEVPKDNFFAAGKQGGIEKNAENREGLKKYDAATPQRPAPEESRRPEKIPTEAELYPPVYESFLVKDSLDSESYQTSLDSSLEVVQASTCSEIIDRIPQGCGEAFDWSTDRVYIWNRVKCENPPSAIRHIYYFKGEKVHDILLNINSFQWRTWSYKTLSDELYIGPWRVDITSVDGQLLKSIEFEIISPINPPKTGQG